MTAALITFITAMRRLGLKSLNSVFKLDTAADSPQRVPATDDPWHVIYAVELFNV